MGHTFAGACLFAVAAMLAGSAAALPVIPGAVGFGIETAAGRGGTVYRVTSLADSGSGTLRECIAASGPRVCVFETSGIIRLSNDLAVWNPNLTIAGQTAPSPGIMLRGATLRIHASDVLVQHITVRPGDDPAGPNPENRDGLDIDGGSKLISNIVIDHCSFSWATDENTAVRLNGDITYRKNIFSEPLSKSPIMPVKTGYNMLLDASSNGRVSLIGNLLSHSNDRNPLTRVGQLVFVNNVVYNHASGTDVQNQNGVVTQNTIIGNVYRRGPPRYVYNDVNAAGGVYGPLLMGTKIHVADNVGLKFDGNGGGLPLKEAWDIVRNSSSLTREQLEATTRPTWVTSLVGAPSNGVLEGVLATAGARPADRNTVDARVIADVRNLTGQVPDCVTNDGTEQCAKNAGGWPVYAANKRTLSLPANPNSDDDGDGYTNLEEFLHVMAASLEGSAEAKPNPPIATVQ